MADYTDPDTWWAEYERCYRDRSWKDERYLAQMDLLERESVESPILDVGCGLGFFVECARQKGYKSAGIEASPAALKFARSRHPLADLREWNAGTPLPFEDASVGGATVIEFVDHIPRAHNEALFDELRRVLKPRGLLLVESPSRFNRFDVDLGHVDFFSPSEFKEFVTKRGFEIPRRPYHPQPFLGSGRAGLLAMRAVSLFLRPEKWAARIDLLARKL